LLLLPETGGLVIESTSQSSAYPSSRRIPAEAETQRRMAFQALHPEVGIAYRDGCETPWVAYWLAPDGGRKYVTGTTMTDVLDQLGEKFGTA
jgi:hypothetical protein